MDYPLNKNMLPEALALRERYRLEHPRIPPVSNYVAPPAQDAALLAMTPQEREAAYNAAHPQPVADPAAIQAKRDMLAATQPTGAPIPDLSSIGSPNPMADKLLGIAPNPLMGTPPTPLDQTMMQYAQNKVKPINRALQPELPQTNTPKNFVY